MEFEKGQQFTNPHDQRTREVVSVHSSRGKQMYIVIRCIDCAVEQKDLQLEVEDMEKRMRKGIFILKT